MVKYSIFVSRYNPEVDERPAIVEYQVPVTPGETTVLEALQFVYEEIDSTLLFNYGCRYKVCGKCTIKIDKKPGLACETILSQGMLLEPLDRFPIIRDLAVDRSGLVEPLREKGIVFSKREDIDAAVEPDDYFRVMACNDCLSCLSVCPANQLKENGGEPLFKMKMAELFYDVRHDRTTMENLLSFYNCTTCQECSYCCPNELKVDEVIMDMRRRLYEKGCLREELMALQNAIFRSGNIYGASPQKRTDIYPSSLMERICKTGRKAEAETVVFVGCVTSYLDMKIVPSLVRALDSSGIGYTVLGADEICCGMPLYLMGSDRHEEIAKNLVQRLEATNAKELVTPCAGCYKMFKSIYPKICDFHMKVYHAVEYLEGLIVQEKIKFKEGPKIKVTYHDPCDLARPLQVFEEPRNILNKMPRIEFVEMKRNRLGTRCCGGGGVVQAHNPGLAKKMAKQRLMDALEVEAELIVSSCVACKDSLKKGLRFLDKKKRAKVKVADITELISQRMEE